jgi:hypothetical protein
MNETLGCGHPDKNRACGDCLDEAEAEVARLNLQIDAWKRYRALLSEELDSAVGMAYIHGWRSTPEKIEAGRKLRIELGIADSGLDSYAGDPFIEKQKDELGKCPECGEA